MWHPTHVQPEPRDPSAMVSGVPSHQPVDLAAAVGAADSALSECLTLYIPGKDRSGNPIDRTPWIGEALALLAQIGGRANILPPVEGTWLDARTGVLTRDCIVLAYTHVEPGQFEASLGWLRGFLHRLGRETNQAEVAFEFADRLDKVRHFDRG